MGVARRLVARQLNALPEEIVWTSGATESINLALKGVAEASKEKGQHLITLATEHPATLDTCEALEARGWRITYLPVDGAGRLALDELEGAIAPDTVLVSVLHGNNEIGTLQDLAAIGRITRAAGVLLHVDAAQTFGKLPLDVDAMAIDLLSISGHKFYGPKGVGALYVRRRGPRVGLAAQIHGGGHERGRRSGTLNVPAIVGFGEATRLAALEMQDEAVRAGALRDELQQALILALDGVTINGCQDHRLPFNLSVSFAHADAASLQGKLPGIAVSTGSACASAALKPSHVLAAIGVPQALSRCTLRFGLGRFTSREEIDLVAAAVIKAVTEVRAANPLYPLARAGLDTQAAADGN